MFEILALVFGIIQSLLIMYNRKENWIFYIAGCICFICFAYPLHLTGVVLKNAIFIFFGIRGWYTFSKKEVPVTYCSLGEIIIMGMLCMALIISLIVPSNFTCVAVLDAITCGLSVAATRLMADRKVEAWHYWIVNHILSLFMYLSIEGQGLFMIVLTGFWLITAIKTYKNWKCLAV